MATRAALLLLLASALVLAASSPHAWSSGMTSPLARHRAAAAVRAAAKLRGGSHPSSSRNSSGAQSSCTYVQGPPNLQFPRDLSAHMSTQSEYWWILGNMQTKSGRQFGVTILVFRTDVTAQCSTLADQLVETAWSISDPATGNFHRHSSLEVGFQLKWSDIATGGPFQLLSSTYGASQTSATGFEVHTRGIDQSRYTPGLQVGWTFQGQLNQSLPDNGFAPVGFNGFVPTHEGPIGAGNLCLNTLTGAGAVQLGNATYDVTGDFWIDHSFWTDPPVTHPGDGWEWLSFQLPNGWRGAFTHLHNKDRTISEYSFANVFRVGATPYGMALRPSEFDIALREPWISPITNITYYTQATVTVPSLSLVVEWRTLQADNENLKHDQQTPYEYEGAARVHATIGGAPFAGMGWMETLRASQGP